MPRKIDHKEARGKLKKMPPETLQAVTVRLTVELLAKIHSWAEEKKMDLATAIRELASLGLESAVHLGPLATVDRKAILKWTRPIERALRDGKSPFVPFLVHDEPELDVLPAVLVGLDYPKIFGEVQAKREAASPWIDRIWEHMKAEAPAHVKPLMSSLDKLERRFLARKKLDVVDDPEVDPPILHWLLSEDALRLLDEQCQDNADVEAIRNLIAARFLVVKNPQRPWDFEWDK